MTGGWSAVKALLARHARAKDKKEREEPERGGRRRSRNRHSSAPPTSRLHDAGTQTPPLLPGGINPIVCRTARAGTAPITARPSGGQRRPPEGSRSMTTEGGQRRPLEGGPSRTPDDPTPSPRFIRASATANPRTRATASARAQTETTQRPPIAGPLSAFTRYPSREPLRVTPSAPGTFFNDRPKALGGPPPQPPRGLPSPQPPPRPAPPKRYQSNPDLMSVPRMYPELSPSHSPERSFDFLDAGRSPTWSEGMPAAACCTNCRTKYSLLNREEGCSACALSFCKKCVNFRVLIPHLSDKPVSVCRDCCEKKRAEATEKAARPAQEQNVVISSRPLPPPSGTSTSVTATPTTVYPSASPQLNIPVACEQLCGVAQERGVHEQPDTAAAAAAAPWGGDGLPPPSMRAQYGAGAGARGNGGGGGGGTRIGRQAGAQPAPALEQPAPTDPDQELATRASKLREGRAEAETAPSITELEERLAALRGCDVELVRNPRSWLPTKDTRSETECVTDLVREAMDRARLEEQFDPDRQIETMAKQLSQDVAVIRGESVPAEVTQDDENRLSAVPSTASHMSEVSETTKEELAEVERVMKEAEKRLAQGKNKEQPSGHDADSGTLKREMDNANKLTKQLSADIEKVNSELAGFWQRQHAKAAARGKGREEEEEGEDEEESETEGELDDDTIARIVREAEQTPDVEEEPATVKRVQTLESTPKDGKKGNSLFGKLFKK